MINRPAAHGNPDSPLRHRPDKFAAVHTLGKQAHPLAIEPEQLDQIAALTAKGKQCAGMRGLFQNLLDQYRQPVEALSHVCRPAGQVNPR
jgi:hypothetical protein